MRGRLLGNPEIELGRHFFNSNGTSQQGEDHLTSRPKQQRLARNLEAGMRAGERCLWRVWWKEPRKISLNTKCHMLAKYAIRVVSTSQCKTFV